jgi:hypothetical protein
MVTFWATVCLSKFLTSSPKRKSQKMDCGGYKSGLMLMFWTFKLSSDADIWPMQW